MTKDNKNFRTLMVKLSTSQIFTKSSKKLILRLKQKRALRKLRKILILIILTQMNMIRDFQFIRTSKINYYLIWQATHKLSKEQKWKNLIRKLLH